MQQSFGYELPKAMHPEFGAMVKAACDEAGRELLPNEIFDIFRAHYLDVKYPDVYKRQVWTRTGRLPSHRKCIEFFGRILDLRG